jgi:hypothetical protein
MPVEEPIVATAVLLLIHVPPDEVLARVADAPSQVLSVPVIAAGAAFIVLASTREHPVASV